MLLAKGMPNRRNFLKGSVGLAVGLSTLTASSVTDAAAENAWIVGPLPGSRPR
jgi:hypothetical protein